MPMSKHPLLTGHTRRGPPLQTSNVKISSQNQCVQINQMEQFAVKISASSHPQSNSVSRWGTCENKAYMDPCIYLMWDRCHEITIILLKLAVGKHNTCITGIERCATFSCFLCKRQNNEETWIVEMCIWCIKISNVLVLHFCCSET
jgi:hypothetical protein